MKYVKTLGLLAVGAAALLSFASPASATVTSPPGTIYTGDIHAHSTDATLHTAAGTIECDQSTIEWYVNNGSTTGSLDVLTFTGCGPDTVTVINKGHLTLQSDNTAISTGLEITKVVHRVIFGFPVTTHCITKTNNTKIGTLTENVTPPVLHLASSAIPHVSTDGACGSTSVWTGEYEITTPSTGIIVH